MHLKLSGDVAIRAERIGMWLAATRSLFQLLVEDLVDLLVCRFDPGWFVGCSTLHCCAVACCCACVECW